MRCFPLPAQDVDNWESTALMCKRDEMFHFYDSDVVERSLVNHVMENLDFKSILETYPALVWFANLVPAIERNILEVAQVIQPVKAGKK